MAGAAGLRPLLIGAADGRSGGVFPSGAAWEGCRVPGFSTLVLRFSDGPIGCFGWRDLGKCVDLVATQWSPVAGFEPRVGERPDADAGEAFDPVAADSPEHLTNLPLHSLAENDRKARGAVLVHAFHLGSAAFDVNAAKELGDQGAVKILIERDVILLLDLMRGVREFLRKVAVVGQNEETLAVLVETANVKKAADVVGEEIEDVLPLKFVRASADVSGGLIENDVSMRLGSDHASADADAVVRGDESGQALDGLAIHGDATLANEVFARATGPETG